jgi:hypothetical protein
MEFKDRKSAMLFFVDKDIDDLRRTRKRSPHLVYTEYYEVENYIFKHGDLIGALSAVSLKSRRTVERAFPKPEEWHERAALLWAPWLKLCLAGCLLGAEGVCPYSSYSKVNGSEPGMEVDPVAYSSVLTELQASSPYDAAEFAARFGRIETMVDELYVRGDQDTLFKGKWYVRLSSEDVRQSGIATGSALKALPHRMVAHMLQSLDFSEEWAGYFRDAVKATLALV